MDDYLRAVFLGALQALTEFLPISSSGHLLLADRVIGEGEGSLTFDVGLHVGTLVAVLAYFWRDWFGIASAGLGDLRRHPLELRAWSREGRLGLFIVAGTIPAVLVGLFLNDAIEGYARNAIVVATMLIGVAALMELLDRSPVTRHFEAITLGVAVTIGVAQAIALVPGVSRSGITIATGRGLGFDRASAARFSFLLSAPAVLGAAVLQLGTALTGDEAVEWGPLLLGALVAALVGLLVIGGLMRFLRTRTLRVFVWYRIALGLVVLAAAAAGAI